MSAPGLSTPQKRRRRLQRSAVRHALVHSDELNGIIGFQNDNIEGESGKVDSGQQHLLQRLGGMEDQLKQILIILSASASFIWDPVSSGPLGAKGTFFGEVGSTWPDYVPSSLNAGAPAFKPSSHESVCRLAGGHCGDSDDNKERDKQELKKQVVPEELEGWAEKSCESNKVEETYEEMQPTTSGYSQKQLDSLAIVSEDDASLDDEVEEEDEDVVEPELDNGGFLPYIASRPTGKGSSAALECDPHVFILPEVAAHLYDHSFCDELKGIAESNEVDLIAHEDLSFFRVVEVHGPAHKVKQVRQDIGALIVSMMEQDFCLDNS